jgi:hypothetical protein
MSESLGRRIPAPSGRGVCQDPLNVVIGRCTALLAIQLLRLRTVLGQQCDRLFFRESIGDRPLSNYLSRRVMQMSDETILKDVSGKAFRVMQISEADGNDYSGEIVIRSLTA